jgi:hypothetical protein
METVLIAVVVVVAAWLWGAVYGWQARERQAERVLKEFVGKMAQEETDEDLTHIVIEKQGDVLYVYSRDDMTFMAQGKNREEVEAVLKERFPGKRFACSEKTLAELGFLS